MHAWNHRWMLGRSEGGWVDGLGQEDRVIVFFLSLIDQLVGSFITGWLLYW